MSDDFQDVDFTSDAIYIRLIFDLVLFQDFYGDLFACYQMGAQSYLAEGTLTERAT